MKSHSDPTKSDLVSATYVIPRSNEFRGAFVGKSVNASVPVLGKG